MVSDDLPRRIRERLDDPTELCRGLGLLDRYKRQAGGGVLIRCPVHEDSSPSCSVTIGPDRTVRWRCFACSASGDALTLVGAVHGLDSRREFKQLLEVAAGLAGITIEGSTWQPQPAPPPRPRPIQKTESPAVPDSIFDEVAAALAWVGSLERDESSDVRSYLAGRGLLAAALADGWFAMGPTAESTLRNRFSAELLHRCGLADESGRLKWPEHALAIPWRNPKGEVQTIQRRHLGTCEAAKRYVFPTGRGPQHPYGIERLPEVGPIGIVEGAVDALAKRTLDSLGWTTVLGSPGVSGWRASWDEIVRDRVVFVAFDADEAGDREAVKLGDRFHEAGAFSVRRATPTRGKDWAEAMKVSA